MYCFKCKEITESNDIQHVLSKNNRHMLKGTCAQCGCKKCKFMKSTNVGGKLDMHSLIGKLPRPKSDWVLPNHRFTGPYNPLSEQLDENDKPLPDQEPYNQVDAAAMKHDI